MLDQPVEVTVDFLDGWRPDPALQTHTAGALANELREAAAAKPDVFSSSAAASRPFGLSSFVICLMGFAKPHQKTPVSNGLSALH